MITHQSTWKPIQRYAALAAVTLLTAALPLMAQVPYPGGLLTENFDGMGTAGTTPPSGWSVQLGSANTDPQAAYTPTFTIRVDNGSLAPAGAVIGYNYGPSGGANRSLGSACTGNSRSVDVAIRNDSGNTIDAFDLGYTGRKWRQGSGTTQTDKFDLYYSGTGAQGSWVAFPTNFNYYSPNSTPISSTRDGLTVFTVISPMTYAPAAPIAAGATFYIRFWDHNPGDTDGGIAVDDFSFRTSVVEPIVITRQPVGTNVFQFRPFSLSVQVTGTRPQYQWYLNDNPISSAVNPTATNANFSDASAQSGVDDGVYYVVVTNRVSSEQSDSVEVVVNTDSVAPTVRQAVGSATFTEVTVQFSEILDPASVTDTANFTLNPGSLNPVSVLLTNAGTVLFLTFPEQQTPDTDYTLSMSYVTDLATNAIVENTTVPFHSWVANPLGGVVFQVYTNLSTSDNSMGQLTNNAKYPDFPDATYILNGLNTYEVFPVDSNLREGFGGRMRTLFVPLATGKYNFFLSSDDGSRLFLNTNGPDPAGAVLVATMDAANVPFTEPPATGTSAAFPLMAGQGYYIEAIYKEGTGGDYCRVGARLEGDPTPAATLTNIVSSGAAAPALPKNLVGLPVVSTPPANATAEEPSTASFSVVAGCTPAGPLVYQWQKSDDAGGTWADIPNATAPTYTTGVLLVATDDQDQYRVVVKSHGGELTSSAATLTVTADVTAPRMVSAIGSTNLTIIVVTYSEAVNEETSGDNVNYTLTGPAGDLIIYGATVLNLPATPGIPTQVELVTDPREFGQNYTLTVDPDVVFDIAAIPNYVSSPYNTVIVAATGVIMPAFYPWKYNNLGILGATNLGSAWTGMGYDDSTWSNGYALFIAKNGTPGAPAIPETNMIAYSQGGSVVLANYFRTHFELSAYPSNVLALAIRPILDDGAIFYLNGVEVLAVGMPTTRPATYDLFANRTQGNDYAFEGPYTLPAWALTNLVYGNNILAVEVHQANATSSDVAFAAELTAQLAKIEPPRPPVISRQPVGGTVNEGQPFAFRVEANGTPPLTYQWYRGSNPITDATNATYLIASARGTDTGTYRVVINNASGTPATSADAVLTVISDTTRPTVLSAKGGPATNITVVVTFSEAVDPVSAGLASNYEVVGTGGITVANAAPSGSTVTLTLSGPRAAGENYSLVVKDVSDTAFTPNLIDPNPTTVPIATIVELISINGQSWKYLQQTVWGEPAPCLDGVAWTVPGYNDSGWQTGFGLFYGNRDATNQPATLNGSVVNTYLNMFTNTVVTNELQQFTHYFRAKFTFPAQTNGATMTLHAMVDDGAVIYLNGNRLYDIRVTNNPASCTNFTAGAAAGGQTWVPALAATGTVLALDGIQTGENTLAVQVHQNNSTSSDVTLGLLLEAEVLTQVPPAPRLSYVYDAVAQTLTFSWTAADYALESAPEVTGPWTVIVGGSPQTVSTASGTKFYRLIK